VLAGSRPGSARRGPVGPAERDRLLGGAVALLHLIDFPEPFGLSVVESLMTGTPVIAYPLGSMPELIRPGLSGFLVSDPAAAVAAVPDAGGLDRAAIRADAIARFSADRMIDDYEQLFTQIITDLPAASPVDLTPGAG
jgi:glycosyltransferase involved in cell wall biosynthesis